MIDTSSCFCGLHHALFCIEFVFYLLARPLALHRVGPTVLKRVHLCFPKKMSEASVPGCLDQIYRQSLEVIVLHV